MVRVKSVLVVDDDPMFAKLLEDILTSDGYRATSAANGVEALALLANEAFDLVMIDIRMPELDGPSFYRELERRNPDQARRVMFMTGGAVGAETAELLSGADPRFRPMQVPSPPPATWSLPPDTAPG